MTPLHLTLLVSLLWAARPESASAIGSAEHREGFGFLFETGYGERVDTFLGLATKDLVCDPDTTIALALTPAELDTIRRNVAEVRLFDLPGLHAPQDCVMFPSTSCQLLLRDGKRERRIAWETGWGCSDSERISFKRLYQVIQLIRRMVEAKPEYRALPRGRGFYY
jgi:hypothetical protein